MRAALLLLVLAVPCSLATDLCAADKTCIPTRDDYNINADANSTVAPLGTQHWVECRGTYALCAFANCTALPGTDPPLAKCGCYEPAEEGERRSWFVTPRQLKSRALYDLTSDLCFDGDAFTNNRTDCDDINSAPVCTGILENWIYSGNYELISTFTPMKGEAQRGRKGVEQLSETDHTSCTGPGVMAECMSAACYRTEAFDGSPITCYCIWVDVPAGQVYGIGSRRSGEPVSCEQPAGYAISGEYTNE